MMMIYLYIHILQHFSPEEMESQCAVFAILGTFHELVPFRSWVQCSRLFYQGFHSLCAKQITSPSWMLSAVPVTFPQGNV